MVIDPTTAQILTKVVLKIAFVGETRKRIIMMALIPIILVLLILTMFVYILTNPFEHLETMFPDNELIKVKELQEQFSLNQMIDINDTDFNESKGIDYSGVTLKDGTVDVVYFNQADKRWADKPYGRNGTIGGSGCGPTALAMVVSSLPANILDKTGGYTVGIKGRVVTDPAEMSDWAYENGYCCDGNGSYHSLIPGGARHFGLESKGCTAHEPQKLLNALANGKLVVAIMGKGHFTQSGHFIVLRGVTSDGKILVADPISKRRSNMEWDLSIILNEACKHAGSGGPFWIIG